MTKQEFLEMKKERTRLFNLLVDVETTKLPEGSYGQSCNIPQVLQWGNLAKVIFCYYLNDNIRTPEMDKNVELLKELSVEISLIKGVDIESKILNNMGYVSYLQNTELLITSLEKNSPYITSSEILELANEMDTNPRLQRICRKRKINTNLLRNIAKDPLFDIKTNLSIQTHNRAMADEQLNSLASISKQQNLYRKLVRREKNPKIQQIIKQYEIVR